MLNKEDLLREISEKLTWIQTNIKCRNAINRMDDNLGMEDLYCGILNIIFADYKLQNANHDKMNYPAIDLADEENGLAVQITSTCTRKKLAHTLEEFFKHNLDQTFSRLIIMLIGEKQQYKPFETKNGFRFDQREDIWDNGKLMQKIAELSLGRLKQLKEYLDEQIQVPTHAAPKLNLPIGASLGTNVFVGRSEELGQITHAMADGVKPIVISGLGGIGKTELVRRFGQTYDGGSVYFATFHNSFRETVIQCIAAGINGLSQQASQDEAYQAAMNHLRGCGKHDVLIIDNVDSDSGTFQDLMDETYAALCALDLRLIITTRFEVFGAVEVAQLRQDELYQIFDNHKVHISEEDKDALISAVDGHTMTVDLMARMMAGSWKTVTVQELLTALKEQDLARFGREIPTDYNRKQKQQRIYDHLKALFDLSGIPDPARSILRCAVLLPGGGMDPVSFGEALPDTLHGSLDELIQHGWLRCGSLLTIHPVIRLVCKEELGPDEDFCTAFLNSLASQYREDQYDAQKLFQFAEVFSTSAKEYPNRKADYLMIAAFHWMKTGRFREALEYGRQALTLKEQQLGEGHPQLCTLYNNLGMTYGALGDHHHALVYLKKALAALKRLEKPDPVLLANYHDNIGYACMNLGDFSNALTHANRALAIRQTILPPMHLDLALSYNNVGSLYQELGNYTKALAYRQQAVAIREQSLDANHPDLATTYDNVGGSLAKLGRLEEAFDYRMKALEIRKKSLPEDHHELAVSYHNVGVMLLNWGDYVQAKDFLSKCLEIRERIYLQPHPLVAAANNDLGCVYEAEKQYEMALSHKMKALKIRETVLPKNHPDLAWSYNNVAYTLTKMMRLDEATQYSHSASEYASYAFPHGHPDRTDINQMKEIIDHLKREHKRGVDIRAEIEEL